MFGLGEDTKLIEEVPGTINLVDMQGVLEVKGTNGKIILHPQPSSDLNDPLRWSPIKKEYQVCLLSFWGFMQSVSTVWSGPIWSLWVEEFGITYSQLNTSSGLCFIFIAVGCVVLQPCASKLGKRFVYLMCTLLQIVGNVVYANTAGVSQLYAAASIVGFASAPMFSLIEISCTDIFFQHQRAFKISYVVFSLYGGVALGPLATGYVTDGVGWKWCPYIMIIIFSIMFIVQLFTLEDSTYRRLETPEDLQSNILEQIRSHMSQKIEALKVGSPKIDKSEVIINVDDDDSLDSTIPKLSYWRRMRIFSTEHADPRKLRWIVFKPFLLCSFPIVVWCGVLQADQQMWLALLSSTQSEFYSSKPYNFSTSKVGLTNLSTLVGIILGIFYGGWCVDKMTIYLARKNKGIMEPEFRLWSMLVPVAVNLAGLLAYGLGISNQLSWALPVIFGQGCLGFSMASITGIAYTYCTDSYPNLVNEGIVFISFVNNGLATIFTFFISNWMERDGLVLMTWMMFLIALGVTGSFLIFILLGKTFRRKGKNLYYKISELGETH